MIGPAEPCTSEPFTNAPFTSAPFTNAPFTTDLAWPEVPTQGSAGLPPDIEENEEK